MTHHTCPVCEKKRPWFGQGDAPKGPCPWCEASLPRVTVTIASSIVDAAKALGAARVIRKRSGTGVLIEDGLSRHIHTWLVPTQTVEQGWTLCRYTESVPVDAWGNPNTEGTVWGQLKADPEVAIDVDRSWTGSF